jgi:hypothetical protein
MQLLLQKVLHCHMANGLFTALSIDTTIDRKMTLMLHAKRCLDAVFDK